VIHRIALFSASLVAALALAAGLALAGFGPGTDQAVAPVSDPVAATDQAPEPIVQVDTVYVAPEPTPEEIVVTEVRAASGHGDEDHDGGEHEGQGEDD
jgi:hypothetical protein